MPFWTPRFPPHDHIYRNKLSQVVRVDGQVMYVIKSHDLFSEDRSPQCPVSRLPIFERFTISTIRYITVIFQSIRSSTILRLPVVRLQYHVDTFNIFCSVGPRILNETPAALLPHKLFLRVLGSTCLLHVKIHSDHSEENYRYPVLNVIISVD